MTLRRTSTLMILTLVALFILSAISVSSSQPQLELVINEKTLSEFRLEQGSVYIKLEKALPYSDKPIQENRVRLLDGEPYVHARDFFTDLGYNVQWDGKTRTVRISRPVEPLPVLTASKLQSLIKDHQKSPFPWFGFDLRGDLALEEAPAMDAMESGIPGGVPPAGDDFSTTNIQVQGVDEGDIVKTDGRYLYQLTGAGRLIISQIYPAEQLQVLASKEFTRQGFYPTDLYLHGDGQIIVIGSFRMPEPVVPPRPPFFQDSARQAEELPEPSAAVIYPYWGREFTRAAVLEFRDTNLETIREIEIEGSYLSSRKVDSFFYLLSSMYAHDVIVPQFRDSLLSPEPEALDFAQIRCLPGCIRPSYVNIVSLDLEDPEQEAAVTSYLGAGREVYMSRENLYMTTSPTYTTTEIYKFAVNGTEVKFAARGEVNGTLLNQFSMDEHEGFFRIATTSRDRVMSNNLFVLNGNLQQVGEITDIAPTERIYAARFMGDKAYLVTFEIIDPFFVIDVSDPFGPKILGELKIPGFSNYLHPLDEHHLLGIGKDVEVVERRDSLGNIIGQPFGVEKGLKMSIFDVSDLHNPLEKHQVILGTQGTYSEALHNHKAVFFDRRNRLIALPVSLSFDYKFNHQGAYVYQVDLEEGFKLIGSESHLETGATHDYPSLIKRTLYVGDSLYFVSDGRISVRDIAGFSRVNSVAVQAPQ